MEDLRVDGEEGLIHSKSMHNFYESIDKSDHINDNQNKGQNSEINDTSLSVEELQRLRHA